MFDFDTFPYIGPGETSWAELTGDIDSAIFLVSGPANDTEIYAGLHNNSPQSQNHLSIGLWRTVTSDPFGIGDGEYSGLVGNDHEVVRMWDQYGESYYDPDLGETVVTSPGITKLAFIPPPGTGTIFGLDIRTPPADVWPSGLVRAPDGSVWACFSDGLLYKYTNTFSPGGSVQVTGFPTAVETIGVFDFDGAGNLYGIAATEAITGEYDPDLGSRYQQTQYIFTMRPDTTNSSQAAKIVKTIAFDSWSTDPDNIGTVNGMAVYCGRLWIGTSDGGVSMTVNGNDMRAEDFPVNNSNVFVVSHYKDYQELARRDLASDYLYLIGWNNMRSTISCTGGWMVGKIGIGGGTGRRWTWPRPQGGGPQ